MNISAQIKNKKKKNNYVVNLSFDIPIKSENLALDQALAGEFTISPFQTKRKMRLKLQSSLSSKQPEINKFPFKSEIHGLSSSRNDKKSNIKCVSKNQQNTTRHSKNHSFSHSKSSSRPATKPLKQFYSLNQTLNYTKIQKKLMSSVDDEIIGYTNPSVELCNQLKNFTNKNIQKKIFNNLAAKYDRNEQTTPILSKYQHKQSQPDDRNLRSQIKKMQKIAMQRKELLNFQYIKQKILCQISARKIQRAWRNYKTKKILHNYSTTLSMKYTNKMKQLSGEQFQQKKILNVKSCGFKNGRNQMKQLIKQTKFNFFEQKQINDLRNQRQKQQNIKSELIPKLETKKKLQMQQIQKWQQLIKQLRKNKDVDKIEQKAKQAKKQLQQTQKYSSNNRIVNSKADQKIKDKKFNEKLMNAINKIQNQHTKSQISKNIAYISAQLKLNQTSPQVHQNCKISLQTTLNKNASSSTNKIDAQNQDQDQGQQANQQQQQLSISPKSQQITKNKHKIKQSNRYKQIPNQQKSQDIVSASTYINIKESSDKDKQATSKNQGFAAAVIEQRLIRKWVVQEQKNKNKQKQLGVTTILRKQQKQHIQDYQSIQQLILNHSKSSNKLQSAIPLTIQQNNTKIQSQAQSASQIRLFHQKTSSQLSQSEIFYNKIHELLEHLCLNSHDDPTTVQQQVQNIVDIISTNIVCQLILQIKRIMRYSEYFYEYFQEFKNKSGKSLQYEKQQKAEGICTNMQSIKDYLQNLVAYILDQYPSAFILGLNSSSGYSSSEIAKITNRKILKQQSIQSSLSSESMQEQKKDVLRKKFFDKHWEYASQQIYFEKKFEDREKQIQRTRKLKQITKIYFQSIFDCFNQCLQQYRVYSFKGQPYIWQKKPIKKPTKVENTEMVKPYIRLAFKRLSEIATVFCGVIIQQKKTNLSKQMAQDIKQQRMNVYLQDEIKYYNYEWEIFRDHQVQILFKIGNQIMQKLIIEFCFWLTGLQNMRLGKRK